MITNIFDLFAAANFPDPRKDEEFRKFLLQKLQEIEDGVVDENNIEKGYDALTASEKAKFLKDAQKQVENNPSMAEKTEYLNKLIDVYESNVDIKKILDMKPEEIDNLQSLPLRR